MKRRLFPRFLSVPSFLVSIPLGLILVLAPLAQAIECPAGTVLIGQPPPDGTELFCAKPGTSDVQIKHGVYRLWYKSGIKRLEGNFNLGEKDGLFVSYHDNGQIAKKERFVRGIRHGKAESFFPNGTKQLEEQWVRGKREGLRKSWTLEGNPSAKVSMMADKKVGPAQYWHKSGKVRSTGFFDRQSKKDGIWVFYNNTGQRTSEGRFRNGKRDGTWRFWESDGSLKQTTDYLGGKQVRTKLKKGKGKGVVSAKPELGTIPVIEPKDDQESSSDELGRVTTVDESFGEDMSNKSVKPDTKTPEAASPQTKTPSESAPVSSVVKPPQERRTYHELLSDWKKEKGMVGEDGEVGALPEAPVTGDDAESMSDDVEGEVDPDADPGEDFPVE